MLGRKESRQSARSGRSLALNRWKLNRKQRLQGARAWIAKYTGSHIVRSYCRHYHVNNLCAMIELKLSGVPITDEEIEAERKREETVHQGRLKAKAAKEAKAAIANFDTDQDEDFANIAGYTSWGFPYGVRWEEVEGLEDGGLAG